MQIKANDVRRLHYDFCKLAASICLVGVINIKNYEFILNIYSK